MTDIDLTVVVTAHSETIVAGPAMRSAERAILHAEAAGFSVERLIGFDAPTNECRAYFSQSSFSIWKPMEFDFRDQGRTRNELAKLASGNWVAFLDADDLFSENWLTIGAKSLAEAKHRDQRVIVHPEIYWFFDAAQSALVSPGQGDPLFLMQYFYFANYYDALCLAPRDAYQDIPYADRDINGGFAYEDWQWNIETMWAGWQHIIAKNTIIFKRRRDNSQTIESSSRKASIRSVEGMAVGQSIPLREKKP